MRDEAPPDFANVRSMIAATRRLAQARISSPPRDLVYRLVLGHLDDIESALDRGALAAFESCRPLGVLAVREFDEGSGEPAEICDGIFTIKTEPRRLAGLPYYA